MRIVIHLSLHSIQSLIILKSTKHLLSKTFFFHPCANLFRIYFHIHRPWGSITKVVKVKFIGVV